MRSLALGLTAMLTTLISGCGSRDACDASTSCGTGSFALCGGDNGCYYQISDGTQIRCAACGDCAAALTAAAAWCARTPPTTTNRPTPNETCQPVSCPSNSAKSLQLCTAGTSCRYLASDGTSFDCGACSSCASVAKDVATWCADTIAPAPGETCTAIESCNYGHSYKLCSATDLSGCRYLTGDGLVFDCDSCADCDFALSEIAGYCNSLFASTTCNGAGTTREACLDCCTREYSQGAGYSASNDYCPPDTECDIFRGCRVGCPAG